jgi:hypothetical protein
MQELCVCCGKLPIVPPLVLSKMPKETIWPLPLQGGFCNPCGLAGCDGAALCKLPASYWERLLRHELLENAWERARGLDRLKWLENERAKMAEQTTERSPRAWSRLQDNYWRRWDRIANGTVLSEVLRMGTLSEYLTEVTMIYTEDNQSLSNALSSSGAISLEEAQARCDDLLLELFSWGLAQHDIVGPSEGIEDNKPSVSD